MDKLDACGELLRPVAFITAEFRRSEGQDRAQAFAARRDQVARQSRDKLHFAVHTVQNDIIGVRQILFHNLHQAGDGGLAVAVFAGIKIYDYCHFFLIGPVGLPTSIA